MSRPEPWQRARRPEQKQERREAILAAALERLDDEGLEATTLSAIARSAGISKANLYRYFESREAILLEVTLEEAQAWVDALAGALAPLAGSSDVDGVAAVVARSLAERPRLCTLVSALASVLEHNVGVDVVTAFKRRFGALVGDVVTAVIAAVPGLSATAADTFTRFVYLFVVGTWPAANPPPAVAEALAREDLTGMCVDFEASVREHARILLRGLTAPGG
ncbi:MAG: TetR family transcriptional regulator [Nannocystaceae bacterium]